MNTLGPFRGAIYLLIGMLLALAVLVVWSTVLSFR
jgi:hypothetical protein